MQVVFLLLLLGPHVGPDDELLDGEVEDQRPDRGVEHGAGQQLVGQVDGEEVGLAGSVQPAEGGETTVHCDIRPWPLSDCYAACIIHSMFPLLKYGGGADGSWADSAVASTIQDLSACCLACSLRVCV